MPKIKEVFVTKNFENTLKSIKDRHILNRLGKQIEKIRNRPDIGKPLRYGLKGERTVYVKPYRLVYAVKKEKLYLLRFLHRKRVYR